MSGQIILASASPRRKQLLEQIGINYCVYPVNIDETPTHFETAWDYVLRMASEKSATCANLVNNKSPVLAADTCVVINGEILGKPLNEEHAAFMLSQLSGNVHYVYTAVSLRGVKLGEEATHFQVLSKSEVKFKTINSKEIKAYWKTGEPIDKAGGYAIQGLASIFVESIKGSFSGIVGLPLYETAELLSKQGIKIIHE